MDPALRRVWTEVVLCGDYDEHMARIGQAQGVAALMRGFIGWAKPAPGARIAIVGAGTGQMLDYLDPAILRPYRLTCTDLNPAYLARLGQRLCANELEANLVIDDIERTALRAGPGLLLATLVLEHIDWRRGVEAFAALRPTRCGVVIQENPPGMTSAVTPGRALPPSTARAFEMAHANLVPEGELTAAFAAHGYVREYRLAEEVADSKRLIALGFGRVAGPALPLAFSRVLPAERPVQEMHLGVHVLHGTAHLPDGLLAFAFGYRRAVLPPYAKVIMVPRPIMGTLETILVVDDSEAVLQVVVAILGHAGFRVLSADSGPNALKVAAQADGKIDLLLSDVDMPEMSGPDLGEALRKGRPGMHVMLMSGGIEGNLLVLNYGWAYIQKPFVAVKLVQMINEVLHSADRSQPGGQGFDSRKDAG